MDLQNFGVNVYLIQVIFGAVDIPAKLVVFLVICYSGRRIAQALSLILAGLSIAGNIFVSHGKFPGMDRPIILFLQSKIILQLSFFLNQTPLINVKDLSRRDGKSVLLLGACFLVCAYMPFFPSRNY